MTDTNQTDQTEQTEQKEQPKEDFDELDKYEEVQPSAINVGDHFRYTTNRYKTGGRDCKYGICKGRDDAGNIETTCYKPLPTYKPFILSKNNKYKELRFYKQTDPPPTKTDDVLFGDSDLFKFYSKCDLKDINDGDTIAYTKYNHFTKTRKSILKVNVVKKTNEKLEVNILYSRFKNWFLDTSEKSKDYIFYKQN